MPPEFDEWDESPIRRIEVKPGVRLWRRDPKPEKYFRVAD